MVWTLLMLLLVTHTLAAVTSGELLLPMQYNWRLYNVTNNSDSSVTGYVQVSQQFGSEWGTVCDDYMDSTTAGALCRWLQYVRAISWCSLDRKDCTYTQHIIEDQFDIYLDNLECKEGAASLSNCTYLWQDHNCKHDEDLILTCSDRSIDEGLSDLSNVTKANAHQVSQQLLDLSKQSGDISAQGVRDVTRIIEGLVQTNMPELGQNVAQTLSNILDVDAQVIQNAEGAGARIVTALERVAVLLGENEVLRAKNLNLSSASVTSETTLSHSEVASVTLPELGDAVLGKTAYLVSYSNDKLFVTNTSETNKQIISVGVDNTAINGLEDPVEMKFRVGNLTEDGSILYPLCVYYKLPKGGSLGSWEHDGVRTTVNDDGSVTCLSTHLTTFSILMLGTKPDDGPAHKFILDLTTYVCLSVSMVGLVLTILALGLKPKLRKSNVKRVHIGLATSLLVGYTMFLIGIDDTSERTLCVFKACLIQLAFLSAFIWMAVEAYTLYLQLVLIFPTSSSGLMTKCTLVSIIVPLIITTAFLTAGLATDLNEFYEVHDFCWLKGYSLYLGFILPIIIIVIGNMLVFILAARNVYKSIGDDAKMNELKVQLRAAVSVLVLLGVTWIFGMLTFGQYGNVFHYIFTVLNGLQGLAIFVFHVLLKPNVRKEWVPRKNIMELFDLMKSVDKIEKVDGIDPAGLERQPTRVKVRRETLTVTFF